MRCLGPAWTYPFARSVFASTCTIGLALPGSALACSLCLERTVRYVVPFIDQALCLMLAFLLVNSLARRFAVSGARQGASLLSRSARALGRLALAVLACIFLLSTGLFICLGYYCCRSVVATFRVRAEATTPWRRRLLLAPTAIAAASFAGLVISSCVKMAGQDTFERYIAYGSVSGPPDLARVLGSDPDFDPERLRPLLRSKDAKRIGKAIRILEQRDDPADISRFGAELERIRAAAGEGGASRFHPSVESYLGSLDPAAPHDRSGQE